MRSHNTTTRTTALALVLLLTVCNLPLSAADKNAHAATIGSVSSVGSVQLRGIPLSNEGTLFSGDRLNVGPGAYARVISGTGQKLEIGANSDVVVSREGDNTSLQMASGNVAFKGNGKGSTRVRIGVYDVVTSADAAGNIAFVGSETFGVHISNGSATVRNTQTKHSFVVQKGSGQLVSIATGANTPSMGQLASSVPTLPPPALPRRQSGSGLSTGTWISIVAAAAGSATLITYFLAREDGDAKAAQLKALTDLGSISQTASATSSVSAQAASVAGQAAAAISASNLSATAKAALQTQVNTVSSAANSAAGRIVTLTAKLVALQNQIANQDGGPTADQLAQVKQLNADLNAARVDAGNAINALNLLLTNANAQGVGGLPTNPNLQTPPATNVGSASVPV